MLELYRFQLRRDDVGKYFIGIVEEDRRSDPRHYGDVRKETGRDIRVGVGVVGILNY